MECERERGENEGKEKGIERKQNKFQLRFVDIVNKDTNIFKIKVLCNVDITCTSYFTKCW